METVARRGSSFAEHLAAYFQARPNLWIDGMELATVAGRYAWRARISDVRRPPFSLHIENRQRRVQNASGEPFIVSEYRYVVDVASDAASASANDWRLTP
jgi:hypothetical protein